MKFISRNFILSLVIFCVGTYLCIIDKLTWEWIVMSISSFCSFGVLEVIKRKIKAINTDSLIGVIKETTSQKEAQ